jgi:hypothetical protein
MYCCIMACDRIINDQIDHQRKLQCKTQHIEAGSDIRSAAPSRDCDLVNHVELLAVINTQLDVDLTCLSGDSWWLPLVGWLVG